MVMRKLLKYCAFIWFLTVSVACHKDEVPVPEHKMHWIVGNWYLVSDSDNLAQTGEIEIHLSFAADGTFELQQKLGDVARFSTYSGTYSVSYVKAPSYVERSSAGISGSGDSVLVSGIYSDGSPWADDYYAEFVSAGGLLVMTAVNSSLVCTYERLR